jgi:hypothetical protein
MVYRQLPTEYSHQRAVQSIVPSCWSYAVNVHGRASTPPPLNHRDHTRCSVAALAGEIDVTASLLQVSPAFAPHWFQSAELVAADPGADGSAAETARIRQKMRMPRRIGRPMLGADQPAAQLAGGLQPPVARHVI